MSTSDRTSIQLITVSPRHSHEGDGDGDEREYTLQHQKEKTDTLTFANPTSLETDGEVVLTLEVPDAGENVDSDNPSSPIDAQALQHVLDTRPSIQRGMRMSMKNRAKNGFSRTRSAYSSLPTRKDRPKTTESLAPNKVSPRRERRRSSLPTDLGTLDITLADIGNVRFDDAFLGVIEQGDLRKSTRRLKDRIQLHHQIEGSQPKVARESLWANFKHVKWPKIKSQWKVVRSWELWKGHMKEIEGHFGTSVVSYFVFLRWLFIMNVIIFAFWFGLVVVPNSIYVAVEDPPNIPSLLACVYDTSSLPNAACFEDVNITAGTVIPASESNLYILSATNSSSGDRYICETPEDATLTTIRRCSFDDEDLFGNGTLYEVVKKESSQTLQVSDMINLGLCNYTNQLGDFISASDAAVQMETLRICTTNVAPYIAWYQYVIDFGLGQGIFNDTLLFYGRYGNVTYRGYSLPLAFFFIIILVYAVSVVLIVYKMGQAYNESYIEVGPNRKVNFCNKLFTAWDFNITDPQTAKLKQAHIRTELEEELADFEKRNQRRSAKELTIVFTIRIFTNLLTFLVLIGAGTAIFYSARFSLENQSSDGISLEGLISPVVITTFNLVLPFLFSFLARFERFKTRSGEIKMTLVRTIFVRLSSLVVLIITLFILIQCSQDTSMDTAAGDEQSCAFASDFLDDFINSNSTETCTVTCWETSIGQEFYKLGLTNFAISAASTISVETFRNIVSRFKYKGLGEKIGKGNFNIPKSILDLIYTQSLLWLGFIFSPMLPAVVLFTSFMLFYVKKYSLIYNLTPDKRGTYRAARTNFLFLLLLLVTLFIFLIPVGYAISGLNPSRACGPFRGQQFMFNVVTDLVDDASCTWQQVLDFLASAGFVIPIIILLVLVIYAQYVLLRTRKASFKLVKKQLILEGANVTHIVGQLDGVLQKVTEHQSLLNSQTELTDGGHKARMSVDHTGSVVTVSLKERMEKVRKESSNSYDEETLVRRRSAPQHHHPALVEEPTES